MIKDAEDGREEKVEEVKEISYLGYKIQRNRGQKAHIKERVKRAAAVMGQVWEIRKRRWRLRKKDVEKDCLINWYERNGIQSGNMEVKGEGKEELVEIEREECGCLIGWYGR